MLCAATVEAAAEPVRVCHLIHELGPGGAEHVLVDLARLAAGAGIELRVLSLMPLGAHRYAQALRDLGVRVDSLDLPSRWDPRGLGRAVRRLRAGPPQLLHSHLKDADLVAAYAAPRLGIPMISTLHLVEDEVGMVGRFKRGLGAWARRRRAARTIAVSDALRRWYLRAFDEDPARVVTIPNGIPAPEPVPAERRAALRAELGVSDGGVLAATVAVFRDGKGHDDLVDAAGLLPDLPVTFVLAGSGPEEARLRDRVRAAGLGGRVVFAGFRDDVAGLLAAADLVVHPSHADALPTALIHALAVGVPVVATDVGGVPEVVGPDAGVLVPARDPAALAAAIRSLAGDPASRVLMSAAARARFAARFEGEAWAARLRALYADNWRKRAVDGKGRAAIPHPRRNIARTRLGMG
jgi:glycosyltransferase involved in cell wall biosynthesis